MPRKWILILLSALVVVGTGVAMYTLDDTKLSSYGTMAAAAGSFLAVIWFTGSLWYQAQQLLDQKTQFLAEFKQLREEGRRNEIRHEAQFHQSRQNKHCADQSAQRSRRRDQFRAPSVRNGPSPRR